MKRDKEEVGKRKERERERKGKRKGQGKTAQPKSLLGFLYLWEWVKDAIESKEVACLWLVRYEIIESER